MHLVVIGNDFSWAEKYHDKCQVFIYPTTPQKPSHVVIDHIISHYDDDFGKMIFTSQFNSGIDNFQVAECDYCVFSIQRNKIKVSPTIADAYDDLFNEVCPRTFCYDLEPSFGVSQTAIYRLPLNFYKQCKQTNPELVQILFDTMFSVGICGRCVQDNVDCHLYLGE